MKRSVTLAIAMTIALFTSAGSKAADIVDTAVAAGNFKTLAAALGAADLVGALKGDGPFTVFAPTDDAFAKLPEGTVESLLTPENKQQLVNLLKYHVVSGRVYSDTAVTAGAAKTLEGSPIAITANADGARVNDANLIATDLDASNGVIHVIDTVLMPPAKSAKASYHHEVCQTLAAAIAKGAPMFNAGHHSACAELYMRTMSDLMHSELDDSMKHHVSTVINAARHQHRSTDRAWTLRRGMDQMFVTLQPSN